MNISQFDQERQVCKAKLERFEQENVLLKYSLSEMVDHGEGIQFLQMAEYFQNELLIVDDKLRNLLLKLEELSNLMQQPQNGTELTGKMTTGFGKLKKEIFQFEKKFMTLSEEFHEKMSASAGD